MNNIHHGRRTRDQDETRRRRKRCNLSVRTNPGNCFLKSPLQQSHLRGAGDQGRRTVAVGNNTDEWASAVGVVGTGSIISGVSIFHSFGSVCYRRRYSVGSTISRTCGANWRNVGSHVNLPPPSRCLHSWTGSDDDLECLNK